MCRLLGNLYQIRILPVSREGLLVLSNLVDQKPIQRFSWEKEHDDPCVRKLGKEKYDFV